MQTQSNKYKGNYDNVGALQLAYSSAENGDYAIVFDPLAVYAWKNDGWYDTRSIEDLSDYYNKGETDNLLGQKEPSIQQKGSSASDDDYYWGGRKTWQDLKEKVRSTVLTGLSTASDAVVSATDTLLDAVGKLQAQVSKATQRAYLTGTGAPSTSTVGAVGQRYVNTSNGDEYTCEEVSGDTYTWRLHTRSVNGKRPSTPGGNIQLEAADVGALPEDGNAATATKLAAPVNIGDAAFDGSADLTLAEIGAATAAQGALAEGAMPKSGGAFTGFITGPSAAMTRLQAEDALYFSGSGNYGVKADGAAGYLWTWGLAGLKVTDNAGTPKPVIASNTSGASSRRYKQEIKPLTDAQARLLLQLRPVSFTYIPALHDPGAKYGLIAEELQAIDPTCVYLDGEGRADGINYTMLVPQLIRLCQLLQQQIDALAQRLAALEQPDAAQPAAAKESAQEAAQADAPDAAAQGGDPDGV